MVKHVAVSTDGNWVISGSMIGAVHFTKPSTRSANFVLRGIRELILLLQGCLHDALSSAWEFDYSPARSLFAGALVDGTVRVCTFLPPIYCCSNPTS